MKAINRSLLISNLSEVSFKSCLRWEIHTNVVTTNDSQMAWAARGYEAGKKWRQADESFPI